VKPLAVNVKFLYNMAALFWNELIGVTVPPCKEKRWDIGNQCWYCGP